MIWPPDQGGWTLGSCCFCWALDLLRCHTRQGPIQLLHACGTATVPLSCPWALVLFLWFLSLCVCVNNFKGCGPGTVTTVLGIDLTAVYTMIKCKVYSIVCTATTITFRERDTHPRSLWAHMHCKENSNYVFPEIKLRGLVPNDRIHAFVSDLYIPRISPPILLQLNMQTDRGNI